jgi:hypothetical protein
MMRRGLNLLELFFPERTAPITVTTFGCLSLDNILISRTKSLVRRRFFHSLSLIHPWRKYCISLVHRSVSTMLLAETRPDDPNPGSCTRFASESGSRACLVRSVFEDAMPASHRDRRRSPACNCVFELTVDKSASTSECLGASSIPLPTLRVIRCAPESDGLCAAFLHLPAVLVTDACWAESPFSDLSDMHLVFRKFNRCWLETRGEYIQEMRRSKFSDGLFERLPTSHEYNIAYKAV